MIPRSTTMYKYQKARVRRIDIEYQWHVDILSTWSPRRERRSRSQPTSSTRHKYVRHEQPTPAARGAAATGLIASLRACLTTFAQTGSDKADVPDDELDRLKISNLIDQAVLNGQVEQILWTCGVAMRREWSGRSSPRSSS